jgi:branched-chain amino acid transport system ATP-binding protein
VLEVKNVHVHYGRIPAVRGISFYVNKGEIVCIIGPNGAGKSTTMQAIAGATPVTQGEILLEGTSTIGLAPERIARRGISLVPEGRHIFTQLTVEENIRLGTDMRRDVHQIENDFAQMLHHFPFLQERLSAAGGKLSGGEQQQLAIARALMTRPKIMLIDEPSLGLAPLMVDRVYEILKSLRAAGNTLLVIEQSAQRALQNSDRVYVMRSGRIEFHGQTSSLNEAELEQAYFGFQRVPHAEVVKF